MTFDELTSVIALIQGMFDLVRVVNVSLTKEFVFKKGSPPVEKGLSNGVPVDQYPVEYIVDVRQKMFL